VIAADARAAAEGARSAAEVAAARVRDAEAELQQARRDAATAAKAAADTARHHDAAQRAVETQGRDQLNDLSRALKSALALEVSARGLPVDATLRLAARTWLYGGAGEAPGSRLMAILDDDAVGGACYSVSQAAGRFMAWCAESFAGAELSAAADVIECQAWAAMIRRIHVLAGEASP
jgi:hypothetical protein